MKYELADEYTSPGAERSLLTRLCQNPNLYWELDLAPEVFAEHAEDYQALSAAVEAEAGVPDPPEDWPEATDPHAVAAELTDLWQRRQLAELNEDLARRTATESEDAAAILEDVEEQAATIRGALQSDAAGRLQYAEDLAPDVLDTIREARQHYQSTGNSIQGVRSGLSGLDHILGGFQEGLTILSGGPGTGKTTLALQMAADAAENGTPALYVTFENTPPQLMLKGVCSCGRLNSRDVRRGKVPLSEVQPAADRWAEKTRRLGFIRGEPSLTRGQIRGKARRMMNRFGSERCLVVVDYLQLYAKAAEDLQHLRDLRPKVEQMGNELRDLGVTLQSPVVALSSQNRTAGYGKDGGGNARMDTLKESGDLEYSADAVVFLTGSDERIATDPARAMDLVVAKNRHGETGTVDLIFRPDYGIMRPEAGRSDPAEHGAAGRAPHGPAGDGSPNGEASRSDGAPF